MRGTESKDKAGGLVLYSCEASGLGNCYIVSGVHFVISFGWKKCQILEKLGYFIESDFIVHEF